MRCVNWIISVARFNTYYQLALLCKLNTTVHQPVVRVFFENINFKFYLLFLIFCYCHHLDGSKLTCPCVPSLKGKSQQSQLTHLEKEEFKLLGQLFVTFQVLCQIKCVLACLCIFTLLIIILCTDFKSYREYKDKGYVSIHCSRCTKLCSRASHCTYIIISYVK